MKTFILNMESLREPRSYITERISLVKYRRLIRDYRHVKGMKFEEFRNIRIYLKRDLRTGLFVDKKATTRWGEIDFLIKEWDTR
jgi:hypothetical protein